jgi:hypothetical protein
MSTTTTAIGRDHRERLQQLTARIRRAVVNATLARDLAAKAECWDEYRAARTEALAVLGAGPDNTPHPTR